MLDSDGRLCSEYHVRTLNVSSYCQPRPSISKTNSIGLFAYWQSRGLDKSTRQIDASAIFCSHSGPKCGSYGQGMVTLVF